MLELGASGVQESRPYTARGSVESGGPSHSHWYEQCLTTSGVSGGDGGGQREWAWRAARPIRTIGMPRRLKRVNVRAMGVRLVIGGASLSRPLREAAGRPFRQVGLVFCGGTRVGKPPSVQERLLAATGELFYRDGCLPLGWMRSSRRRAGQRVRFDRRTLPRAGLATPLDSSAGPQLGVDVCHLRLALFSWHVSQIFGASIRDGTWAAGFRRGRVDLVCLAR
jgi:hypothetical protein